MPDPIVSFRFQLEVSGSVTGYFNEVSGIGSEHEIVEFKVMESDGHTEGVHKIPGRLKWENITLKRGITTDMQIWDWRQQVVDGAVESARKGGSIVMLDEAFTPVARWDFLRAWPSKVTGPSPKADSNEVGVEELTLTHEGIKRNAV